MTRLPLRQQALLRLDQAPWELAVAGLTLIAAGWLTSVVVTLEAVPREDATASTRTAGRAAALPVLVVVAAGSAADQAVAHRAAESQDGRLIAVPRDGVTPSMLVDLSQSPAGRTVVVGGVAAVSDDTVARLRPYTSGPVTRIAGADRYETSARVAASQFSSPVKRLQVVRADHPDGFVAGTDRSDLDVPLVLLGRDRVPDATADVLRRLRPERIEVLGTHAEISDTTLVRLRRISRGEVTRVP